MELLNIYNRFKNIYKDAEKVYNTFKKLVLSFIDNVSSNRFVFKKFGEMYNISKKLIEDYESTLIIFSPNSEVMKLLSYLNDSGISMYNFFDTNVLNTIKAVSNACYQVDKCISNDLDLVLRSAGTLCFSNLMDGRICTIYEIRPRCGFLGGLENSPEATEIVAKIEELVDTKKFMQAVEITNMAESYDEYETVNNLVSTLVKKIIENEVNKQNKNLDVNTIYEIIDTDKAIKNPIVMEIMEYMKKPFIKDMQNKYGVLEDISLIPALTKYIKKIVTSAKSNDDLKIENGELSKEMQSNTADELDELYSSILDEKKEGDLTREKRINENIKKINTNMDNYINKENIKKRRIQKYSGLKRFRDIREMSKRIKGNNEEQEQGQKQAEDEKKEEVQIGSAQTTQTEN